MINYFFFQASYTGIVLSNNMRRYKYYDRLKMRQKNKIKNDNKNKIKLTK